MKTATPGPWTAELQEIRNLDLYRTMPVTKGLPGRMIEVDGRPALNFSSNNYLGLAGHPKVIRAGVLSAELLGAGATASRLIAGNTDAHRELEHFIAQWKGTEAAVLFGSGYQANLSVPASLTDDRDLIISDQFNHASIIDGCRLSGATVKVYPHCDLNRLEDLLRSGRYRRKIVVTESVFSMDGDAAPLKDIEALCRRWGGLLMVDEAHATGVRGPNGQGLAAELGVVPEIQMGTLGKAVGVAGAYVAGSGDLIALLVNRARPLIYTTASPPSLAASALAALQIISSEEGEERRARLRDNCVLFCNLLRSTFGDRRPASHIVPVVIGESAKTMRVSEACREQGIFAHGIRFPTVPEGTARLRFTLMSDHTAEDVRKAVSVTAAVIESLEDDEAATLHALGRK